jgi:hypothetical protein
MEKDRLRIIRNNNTIYYYYYFMCKILIEKYNNRAFLFTKKLCIEKRVNKAPTTHHCKIKFIDTISSILNR